ncbi:uncharacterized protein LOC143021633 [Oratosquilla oratoria]|uniref:uncharacterized protein LOC143021633 n=1 Tax=Oratosquilla oratoria TaxID=337810 RepID=UPI003F771133
MASSNKIGPFNPEELPFDVYLALFEAHVATQDITDPANLTAPDMPSTKTYDELITLMKNHFITKPSYHRSLCSFQQRRKVEKETVKELYADLKRLAKDCNFGTMFDARLRDQLFMAVDHEPYFKYLLAEDLKLEALTSSTLLERILSLEKAHMGEGERGNPSLSGTVQKVHSKTVSKCKHCGFLHPSSVCRFKDSECHYCGRQGYLEIICRFKQKDAYKQNSSKSFKNKNVKSVSEPEPEHEEHQCSVYNVVDKSMLLKVSCNCLKYVKPEMYNFVLNDKSIPLEIYSGSCVSLLGENWIKVLNVKMTPSSKKLTACGGHQIKVKGQVDLVRFNNYGTNHISFVTDSHCNDLCGRDLMNKVGIKITGLYVALSVNSVNDMDVSDNPKQLLGSYRLNENLPIKGDEAKIYMKKGATPKFIKSRLVPLAHKELVDIAIYELVENEVQPVSYSDWASPIVPVLKDSGKMRTCADFKHLNGQTNIERYPLPKLDEMLATVGDNKVFYDILICAKSREDQSNKVKLVLNKLAEANVKLNLEKCEFNKIDIDFLDYVISPSPNKLFGMLLYQKTCMSYSNFLD